MCVRSLIGSLVFGVTVFATAAFAGEEKALPSLADYQGHFTSVESVWTDARTEAFYQQIAEEAKKAGKQATAESIKETLCRRYYAPFAAMDVKGDTITFTGKDGVKKSVTYKFAGAIAGGKGTWNWFTATEADPRTAEYRNIVMTALHGKDPKHFHFKIGSADGATLMNDPFFKEVHGTCQVGDVDYDAYMKDFDPARYVKFAM